MGLTDPTLRRAGYCFTHPRQGGHGWSRAAGIEPPLPACPLPRAAFTLWEMLAPAPQARPRGTEHRVCGSRGRTGHRPTQSRSTQEGETALRLGGFCGVFFKRHVQLQPRRAQQCCGLSPWRRGEEKGSAAQQQVPSALRKGRGGGQKPTRGGDIRGPVPGEPLCLVGMGQAPRPSQPRHGQATAQERTNLGCSWVRGSPGKLLIVHGKANRAHSPGPGKHGDPRAALQDGVQLYPGVRCW